MAKRKKKTLKQQQNGGRPQPTSNFREEMQRLKDERRKVKDEAKRVEMAKRHEQIKAEFKTWQNDLIWLIKNKSRIHVASDGSAQYVMPAELVRLVWQTTIRQRVAAEQEKNPRDAAGAVVRAMEGLRDQVESMAQAYKRAAADESSPPANKDEQAPEKAEESADVQSEHDGIDQADGRSAEQPSSVQQDGSAG